MDEQRRAELTSRYQKAAHAMQTGVGMMMHHDSKSTEPKHLRVGVNGAMVDHAALAGLLIKKGVVTEEEYLVALCEGMEVEVARYTTEVQNAVGGNIKITLV